MEAYGYQFRFGPHEPWQDGPKEFITCDRAQVEKVLREALALWVAQGNAPIENRIVILTPTRFEPLAAE